MNNGGARPGAGRPKGTRNRATKESIAKAANGGILPLDYMLDVMRNAEKADTDGNVVPDQARRDWAANAAGPYLHPRLAATDINAKVSGNVTVNIVE